jgi:AraC-like DNA-binding protein
VIDDFLAGPGWARFDPDLGYLHRDSAITWGIDGSRAIETYEPHGARTQFMYPDRRARVNCYGESFTESIQVNDGETWEEYLAAHLGEPVANYGVGGCGPYQAYRRMLREEVTHDAGSLVVFYVLDASMVRSAIRSLWALVYPAWAASAVGRPVFHGNFWPSIELDLGTGAFVERENLLRTPDDLYRMTDPQWMMSALRDDLALRLAAVELGLVDGLDDRTMVRLADALGVAYDPGASDRRAEAARLSNSYGQAATIEVLERVERFCAANGRRLLVVLNSVSTAAGAPRHDARVLEHLRSQGVPSFDMTAIHQAEHAASGLSFESYMAGYVSTGTGFFSGHYTPIGNHRFAYAIKRSVIGLLARKPLPYGQGLADPAGLPVRRVRAESGAAGTDGLLGASELLGPLLRVLNVRFAENWDVDALARLAGVSRSSLHRRFGSTLGVGPMDYVRRLRVEEAARLLQSTDLTTARIAERVGLGDAAHLSREFRRRFGIAPSAYRRTRGVGRSDNNVGLDAIADAPADT